MKPGIRKFTIAGAVWVSATIGLLAGKLAGAEFVTLCTWLLGLYGAANVGEHYVNGETPRELQKIDR